MADKILLAQTGKGKKLILKLLLSVKGLSGGSVTVGLWRMDTNEVVGHSEVASGADVSFTSEFHCDHFMSADLPVKFCVYEVTDGTVSKDTFVGTYTTSLAAIFKTKTVEASMEGTGTLCIKATILPDPNAPKKEKKEKAETGPKLSKEEEKANKTALKEGGKKGQDLAGMSTFGVHFFNPAMDSCGEDWKLMELCMQGMNKEVDPDADDRKGGAGDLGKILFSAGPTKVIMYAHVPEEVKKYELSAKQWLEAVCAPIGGKILECSENFGKAEALGDADKGLFPLKMRDTAVSTSFDLLRKKGLVMEDDSDDDINFADECGVDLNAGADGSDY